MDTNTLFTSPKRCNGFYIDPSLLSDSPPIKDISMYPWNWGSGAQKIALSPSPGRPCTARSPLSAAVTSLNQLTPDNRSSKKESSLRDSCSNEVQLLTSPDSERKRGRPRADSITNLILEGSQVTQLDNAIRCQICNRVFPREKSLQAHMRTHTGTVVDSP